MFLRGRSTLKNFCSLTVEYFQGIWRNTFRGTIDFFLRIRVFHRMLKDLIGIRVGFSSVIGTGFFIGSDLWFFADLRIWFLKDG